MKNIILLFLLLPFITKAQEKGIHFESGLSWPQVKEKARIENKHLFVDCYTTWCAPCKIMANDIFPQEKVGTFFNKNFVNVKIQFDQTKNDSEEVKSWYADAKAIDSQYTITAYPTFLIFSPQGELVHRIVGGGSADDLIARASVALDPKTQYYTMLKEYGSGTPTPMQLKQLAIAADEANEDENAEKFAEAFMDLQDNPFTKDNLLFLSKFVKKSSSKGFKLMLNNIERVDGIIGRGKANEILGNVIIQEEIYPAYAYPKTNIDSVIAVAQSKYPMVDITEKTDMVKIFFLQMNKNWDSYQSALTAYMDKHGYDLNPSALNFFARTILENGSGTAYFEAATVWSKRCVDQTSGEEPAYLDTYANLLYKLEKKEEAIVVQQKAVDLSSGENKARLQSVLDKMITEY